jgi:hypothetical protein
MCNSPSRTCDAIKNGKGQEEHRRVCSGGRRVRRAALPGTEFDKCSRDSSCLTFSVTKCALPLRRMIFRRCPTPAATITNADAKHERGYRAHTTADGAYVAQCERPAALWELGVWFNPPHRLRSFKIRQALCYTKECPSSAR